MIVKMERLGCSTPVVGLVIPSGYSFNLDGTSIYLTIAALFIAQATNTHLTFGREMFILLILMLNSKGAATVTGGGFITLAATLSALGTIPIAGLTLLLGVDRFMSEMRSLTNIAGNAVATVVVAKWEGEFDDAPRAAHAERLSPGPTTNPRRSSVRDLPPTSGLAAMIRLARSVRAPRSHCGFASYSPATPRSRRRQRRRATQRLNSHRRHRHNEGTHGPLDRRLHRAPSRSPHRAFGQRRTQRRASTRGWLRRSRTARPRVHTHVELAAFRSTRTYDPTGVPVALGSYDVSGRTVALAFFVNQSNPIAHLSFQQLDAIYCTSLRRGSPRPITTWGQLGLTGDWAAHPIHPIGVNFPDGISNFIRLRVCNDGELRTDIHTEHTGGPINVLDRIVTDVATDPAAIGYAGFANLQARRKDHRHLRGRRPLSLGHAR